MKELVEFIEDLPSETVKVKVCLGSTRTRLKTIHVFDEIPTDYDIEQILISAGFGEEHEFARVFGVDDRGKSTRSKSLLREIKRESDEDPLRILAEEFRLLMRESRQMLAVNNDSFAAVVENNRILTEQNFRLRGDIFSAESATLALDMELQALESDQNNDLKTSALGALVEGVKAIKDVQAKKTQSVTAETMKDILLNADPETVSELLSNDEVKSFVVEAMMGATSDAE